MKRIRCMLGIHKTSSVSVEYGIDIKIVPGSEAAILAWCDCGDVKILSSSIPVRIVRYELPKATHKLVPIEDKE